MSANQCLTLSPVNQRVRTILCFNFQSAFIWKVAQVNSSMDFRRHNIPVYTIAEVGMGQEELWIRVQARVPLFANRVAQTRLSCTKIPKFHGAP